MSYISWHNYGYGIRVDDIKKESLDRIQALIHLAPDYEEQVQTFFRVNKIEEPTYTDYMEVDQDCYLGLATILREVIREAENVSFIACDDYNGVAYLLYPPSYPWHLSESERGITESRVEELLRKYVNIITDEEISIEYYAPENGG